MIIKKFYTLVLDLGLQDTTVAEAHSQLEREDFTIPVNITRDAVEELYEYLYEVVHAKEYSHCLATPVGKFLEGRIVAIQKGYDLPPTIPPTAIASASNWHADGY